MLETNESRRLHVVAIGRPPVPREHGAWAMLIAPIVLGYAAAGDADPLHWGLLAIAACAIFCARNAAGLVVRRRTSPGTMPWLIIFAATAVIAILPLCGGGRLVALAKIGVAAGAAFAAFSLLQALPAAKRLDRTRAGEVLGASGLALTGPAAYAIATGRLDLGALWVWLAASVYFTGAILYVKSWLEAARHRSAWSGRLKFGIAAPSAAYHVVFAIVPVAMILMRIEGGMAAALAVAPIALRAWVGAARLSPKLPNLKLVGTAETALNIWYFLWMIPVIRDLCALR